jgi:hypothetical protein
MTMCAGTGMLCADIILQVADARTQGTLKRSRRAEFLRFRLAETRARICARGQWITGEPAWKRHHARSVAYDRLYPPDVPPTRNVDDTRRSCGLVVETSCVIMRSMPRRTIYLLLLILPALVLFAAVVAYQLQETRQLAGVIRDAETHAPLQGAAVAAGDAHATTNAQGAYALEFTRGDPSLTVTLDGYLPAQQTVRGSDLFADGIALDVDLTPNYLAGYVLDAETNQTLGLARVLVGDGPRLSARVQRVRGTGAVQHSARGHAGNGERF